MQKFLGQGLNLCHSSDNTGFLGHCATKELQKSYFLKRNLIRVEDGSWLWLGEVGWRQRYWKRIVQETEVTMLED